MSFHALFVYDSDCGFCSRFVRYFSDKERINNVNWVTSIEYNGAFSGYVSQSALFIEDEKVFLENRAIGKLLIQSSRKIWRFVGRILLIPRLNFLFSKCYRTIAKNRKSLGCRIR